MAEKLVAVAQIHAAWAHEKNVLKSSEPIFCFFLPQIINFFLVVGRSSFNFFWHVCVIKFEDLLILFAELLIKVADNALIAIKFVARFKILYDIDARNCFSCIYNVLCTSVASPFFPFEKCFKIFDILFFLFKKHTRDDYPVNGVARLKKRDDHSLSVIENLSRLEITEY